MINKEIVRVNVNRAYDAVTIYNAHIAPKSFHTALFDLRSDFSDISIQLYSEDSNFIKHCGATFIAVNNKLYESDDIYFSFDGDNLAVVTKYNNTSTIDASILCCGRFYVGSSPYVYIYSNTANNAVNADNKEVVVVYSENEPDKLWSSAYGTCTATVLHTDNNITHLPNYRGMLGVGEKKAKHKRNINTNTLNEITMVLPVYFYVKDSPEAVNMWKYIGTTNFFGLVSMYNMDTFHISQVDYPVSGNRYMCCSLYKRRTIDFSGIAIKLSNTLESLSDNVADFDGMQSNTTDTVLNINNTTTGIIAYGGDCTFIDGTPGCSIDLLTNIYRFRKLIVEYTDDSGLELHSVDIDVRYLQSNSTNSYFDLLMDNVYGLFWHIDLTKSTGLFLSGVTQNCGIVSIKGMTSDIVVEDDFNELPSIQ